MKKIHPLAKEFAGKLSLKDHSPFLIFDESELDFFAEKGLISYCSDEKVYVMDSAIRVYLNEEVPTIIPLKTKFSYTKTVRYLKKTIRK